MNARFLPYARENRPTRQVIEHFNRHGIIIGPNIAAWSITFGFLGNAYGMREFWRVWDQLPNAGMRMSFFATVAICPRSRGHLDREYRNYRERWHSEPGLLASAKMQSPAYCVRYRCNDYTKIAINIDFLFDERCCWVEHLSTSLAYTPLRSASRRAT